MRDFSRMQAELIAKLEQQTRGKIALGATRLEFWPSPRVFAKNVTMRLAHGDALITAGEAMIRFDPRDLITGGAARVAMTLRSPLIELHTGPLENFLQSPRALVAMLDRISGAFEGIDALRGVRLDLEDAQLRLEGLGEAQPELLQKPLHMRLRYEAGRGRIDLRARREGAQMPFDFALSLPDKSRLRQGGGADASLYLEGLGAIAKFTGTMSDVPDAALNGKVALTLDEAFLRRLGLGRGGTSATQALEVSAQAILDQRGGNFEGLTIARGKSSVIGIAALRENAGRWSISSTLAGDLFDGSAAHAGLQRLFGPDGQWSAAPLDFNPAPTLDLDIRLSTRQFKLGQVTLENAALSLFTRPGRAEFAIADAGYRGGSVKARALISERLGGQELRLQLSGERIDGQAFLNEAFGFSRLKGRGNFVFQAQGSGNTLREIMRSLAGSGATEWREGEFTGIDVERLMAVPSGARPEVALATSLGGATAFEMLNINFAIQNGRIEPSGAILRARRFEATLEGAIDLANQQNALAVILRRRQAQPGTPEEFFAFRIGGPLFAPVLKPDSSLLQQRS